MTERFADRGTPSRAGLRAVIPRRHKVGPWTSLLLALAFAVAVTPVLRIDVWLATTGVLEVRPGEPSPVTVRVPPFAGDPAVDRIGGGAIVIARGEIASPQSARTVAAVRSRIPRGLFGDLAYFAVVLALTAIYTSQLRRSNPGRLLRTQVVLLGMLLVAAIGAKAVLLLSPVSVLAVPVALLALATAMAVDRGSGIATAVLGSILIGLLAPFDVGVTAILLIQSLTAVLLLPDRIKRTWQTAVGAGAAAAIAGVLAYGVVHYLTRGSAPVDELSRLTASSWVAAGVGGVIAALTAALLAPAIQLMLGEITDARLVALEDLSHPLLRQISEKSPGTWQHSLAMANMAEIAANAIGANGRLVRVGAYFHDLGKSLQPKYFIENVESGEQSPHDRLPPEVSCDAIFSHVTEGIALARRNRLPERIIDFMHMHHGDGVLEYFWAKCQEQGNANGLTSEHFRYPGVPPQSRETAILAICDAVEAASRTLRRPDAPAIGNLVQRIVYGKLHLGQLDESGLSMADLRKISDSLRETIKHAHHGRIEYPWQREEREREQLTVAERPGAPVPAREPEPSITQRFLSEPRLDSLDAPRPPWAAGGSDSARRKVAPAPAAVATTVPVATTDPNPGLPPAGDADTVSMRTEPSKITEEHDAALASTAVVTVARPPAPEPAPAVAVARTDEDVAEGAIVGEEGEAAPGPELIAPVVRWSGTFAAAAEQALTHVPAHDDEQTRPVELEPSRARRSSAWGATLADRIDAMLDVAEPAAHDADPAAPAEGTPPTLEIVDSGPAAIPTETAPVDTARRQPPPPPRSRRPHSTLEVDGDDVEATIEVAPTVGSRSGPIVGPPPATRAAPVRRVTDHDDEDDAGDDEVTIVPARPHSTMLPPRPRTHGKPTRE